MLSTLVFIKVTNQLNIPHSKNRIDKNGMTFPDEVHYHLNIHLDSWCPVFYS